MTVKNAATDPDHDVIGRHFIGPCMRCEATSHVFYCDSYDTEQGFWLTRADCPAEHAADTQGEWRKNISERAIGASYHRIWDDGPEHGRPWSRWGVVDRERLTVPLLAA